MQWEAQGAHVHKGVKSICCCPPNTLFVYKLYNLKWSWVHLFKFVRQTQHSLKLPCVSCSVASTGASQANVTIRDNKHCKNCWSRNYCFIFCTSKKKKNARISFRPQIGEEGNRRDSLNNGVYSLTVKMDETTIKHPLSEWNQVNSMSAWKTTLSRF